MARHDPMAPPRAFWGHSVAASRAASQGCRSARLGLTDPEGCAQQLNETQARISALLCSRVGHSSPMPPKPRFAVTAPPHRTKQPDDDKVRMWESSCHFVGRKCHAGCRAMATTDQVQRLMLSFGAALAPNDHTQRDRTCRPSFQMRAPRQCSATGN